MIEAYCVNDITIRRLASRDQWGEPTYTDIAVKGYVEWRNRLIRDIKGENVFSSAMVYLVYDSALTHDDRLIIDGVEHAIIQSVRQQDFSTSHLEVFIT